MKEQISELLYQGGFMTEDEIKAVMSRIARIGETLNEMLDEDYDHEDIKSYITQHLIK